ncbi:MAG: AAA family ATPase [Anaerolineales bacterium]|nr:MAG: AAA family ATPase [Anaerolineales bacterium]
MITYLKMTNWRKYENRELLFKKGITFLMGENGSGKTSILEAINYAFTGESALFQKSSDRPALLRDPKKPGTIILRFVVDDSEYEIMRTQNPDRAGNAHIINLNSNKFLAQSHAGVTKQVENLLLSSNDFLRRITYMAEGDVFNFLQDPPQDALDNQIRAAIGLTQLEAFAKALKSSQKELNARLKTLQMASVELSKLEIRTSLDLENKLRGSTTAKEQFLAQLEDIGSKLAKSEQNVSIANNIKIAIDELHKEIMQSPKNWQGLHEDTVFNFYDQLQTNAHVAENHHSEIRLALAKLDGQEEAYKRVISLLEPFKNSDDTVPCPVCRKPMTKSERKGILEEIKQDVEKLNEERSNQDQAREQTSKSMVQWNKQIEKLFPLRNLIAQTQLKDVHPSDTFSLLSQKISQIALGKPGSGQEELLKQRETVRERIKELDVYAAEYQAGKKRLSDLGFDSPEDLQNGLVQIETRLLSLRAANQAIDETLQSQQNTDMRLIYKQIADLWSSFREDEGWDIEYNTKGLPVITKDNENIKLDLRQLSGGEKTALLIMVHTILAHHFSKSDFLMIDEPLEHLDPVNRRSLIKFLVDAYNHQIFGQAIIATFEESLIRKYQSNEGVNIVLV